MKLLLLTLAVIAHFGSCQFVLYSQKLTWQNALAYCEEKGLTLAKVTSSADNLAIMSLRALNGALGDAIWIGGNDIAVENTFRWTDGTLLSSGYQNFPPGEPNNNLGNEDCVVFARNTPTWNDLPCSRSNKFVCGPVSTGNTAGDPVVKTFDGYEYEYQGLCSYVLLMDCNSNYAIPQKNFNNFDQFKLIGTNEPCDLGTCLRKVTLVLKKSPTKNIRVQFIDDKVLVNGKKVKLSQSYSHGKLFKISNYKKRSDDINDPQTSIVDVSLLSMHALNLNNSKIHFEKVIRLETNFGLIVDWNGFTSKIAVTMKSYDHDAHKTCGLMGNLDGNVNNDLRFPDGNTLEHLPTHFESELDKSWTVQTFVHHWLNKQPGDPQTCKSSTPRKLCNGNNDRKEYAKKMCNRIVKTLDVKKNNFRRLVGKCLHDMCFCYNDDIFECAAFIFKSLSKSVIG